MRLALLIAGLAGLTIARAVTWLGLYPDSTEPRIPALLWLFHQVDALFLPGANHLHGRTPVLWIQCVALGLALGCFYLAARATAPPFLRRRYRPLAAISLVLAGLLFVLVLQGTLPYRLVIGGTHHYGNDGVVMTGCAIDALRHGENPYRSIHVIPCLRGSMDETLAATKTTPVQAGAFRHIPLYPTTKQLIRQFRIAEAQHQAYPAEFESAYNYPAASFLIPAIVVALGVADLSIFFALCYVGIAALVLWRARGAARWVAAIAIAANAALWPTLQSGAADSLYALLVLLAWLWRDRRWASALLLGLAVSTRQQAWFYLLFYAVLIERTEGRRELLWRLGIVSGVFALTNLPYVIDAPGLWLSSVLGPLRDPMFPLGSGLIALSIGDRNRLPLAPRGLYSILEIVVLVACLLYYRRTCRDYPGSGLVLAPVALFFAWRSLYSYFLPLSLLALYPALVEHAGQGERCTVREQAEKPLLKR